MIAAALAALLCAAPARGAGPHALVPRKFTAAPAPAHGAAWHRPLQGLLFPGGLPAADPALGAVARLLEGPEGAGLLAQELEAAGQDPAAFLRLPERERRRLAAEACVRLSGELSGQVASLEARIARAVKAGDAAELRRAREALEAISRHGAFMSGGSRRAATEAMAWAGESEAALERARVAAGAERAGEPLSADAARAEGASPDVRAPRAPPGEDAYRGARGPLGLPEGRDWAPEPGFSARLAAYLERHPRDLRGGLLALDAARVALARPELSGEELAEVFGMLRVLSGAREAPVTVRLRAVSALGEMGARLPESLKGQRLEALTAAGRLDPSREVKSAAYWILEGEAGRASPEAAAARERADEVLVVFHAAFGDALARLPPHDGSPLRPQAGPFRRLLSELSQGLRPLPIGRPYAYLKRYGAMARAKVADGDHEYFAAKAFLQLRLPELAKPLFLRAARRPDKSGRHAEISAALSRIAEYEAVRAAMTQDPDDADLLFDAETDFVREVRAALPRLREAGRRALGAGLAQTRLFLFTEDLAFESAYRSLYGGPIQTSWQRATGDSGAVMIAEDEGIRPRGLKVVLHELGHAWTHAYSLARHGRHVLDSPWIDEGLAEYIASREFPEMVEDWRRAAVRGRPSGAPVPTLEELSIAGSFYNPARASLNYNLAALLAARLLGDREDGVRRVIDALGRGTEAAAWRAASGKGPGKEYAALVRELWGPQAVPGRALPAAAPAAGS